MLSLTPHLVAFAVAAPGAALLVSCAGIWVKRSRVRQRREWLRETVNRIDDAVVMTDGRGAITAMNRAAESLTDWNEAEAIGQPVGAICRLVDNETGRPVVNPVVKALYKGVVVGTSMETTLIGKHGTERRVCDTAAPIRDDRGRILGCALAFRETQSGNDSTRGMTLIPVNA